MTGHCVTYWENEGLTSEWECVTWAFFDYTKFEISPG